MAQSERDKTIRKSRLAALAVALVALFAAFVAGGRLWAPEPQSEISFTTASGGGLYQVMLETEGPLQPLAAGQAWTVVVTQPDGTPVSDASVTLAGRMPQTGHPLPETPPPAAAIGDGRYRIATIGFDRNGHWAVEVRIAAATGSDTALFDLDL